MDTIIHILSDARGTYIPRDFLTDQYNDIAREHCRAWGLTESNESEWLDATNPDSEGYWDAWEWVCNHAKFTADNGDTYRLYQDGDLWGICYERMTDEERANFGFDN